MEKLTNPEKAAELVYEGMRKGMSREEFVRRMSALDQLGKEGVVASSYCTWLLLRNQPPSEEKEQHMQTLADRVRAAVLKAATLHFVPSSCGML